MTIAIEVHINKMLESRPAVLISARQVGAANTDPGANQVALGVRVMADRDCHILSVGSSTLKTSLIRPFSRPRCATF